MLALHRDWAWVVVATNGLVGVWALLAHRWPRWRSRAMWWAVLVAEATNSTRCRSCSGACSSGCSTAHAPDFHAFYGFGTLIATVIIFGAHPPQLRHVKYLLYGLGSLFLMGMALRDAGG